MRHPQDMVAFRKIAEHKFTFSIGRTTCQTVVYTDIGTVYGMSGCCTYYFSTDGNLRPYITHYEQHPCCQRTPFFHCTDYNFRYLIFAFLTPEMLNCKLIVAGLLTLP